MASNFTVVSTVSWVGSGDGTNSTDGKTVLALCHATNVIILCCTLWIIASMLYYGKKTGKLEATESGKLYTACFVAICLALPRIIMEIFVYHVKDIPGASMHCELLVDITNGAYGFSLGSTYVFLWMRQRTIYQHPFVSYLYGRFVKVLSLAFLVVLFLSVAAIALGYIAPTSFTYSTEKEACVFIPKDDRAVGSGNWFNAMRYILVAGMVFAESVLLFLFVYPMIRIKRARKRNENDRDRDSVTSIIRRSTICTAVAVFSDVFSTILVLVISRKEAALVGQTMYNISILVNDLCIAATFEAFPKILTVFFRKSVEARRSSHSHESGPTRVTASLNDSLSAGGILTSAI